MEYKTIPIRDKNAIPMIKKFMDQHLDSKNGFELTFSNDYSFINKRKHEQ